MEQPDLSLFSAIGNNEWETARALVKTPDAHRLVECDGSYFDTNTLHLACGDNVPLDVWRDLLNASTKAPLQQDKYGRVPLHEAIESTSSDETVLALIDACPQAATIGDMFEESPLSLAIRFNRSVEIIRRLLKAHPSTVMTSDRDGDTPLAVFFRKWNMNLRDKLDSMKNNKYFINDQTIKIHKSSWELKEKSREVRIKEIYDKAVLLLQAVTHGTVEDLRTPFLPLHASITTPECPWSISNTILRTDYKQVHQCDEEGNFPIHIAAAAKSSFDGKLYKCYICRCKFDNSSWYQEEKDFTNVYAERHCKKCARRCWGVGELFHVDPVNKIPSMIKDLLEATPEVANFPNLEGRLPLHIAVENEKPFEEGGVKTIFQASPRSLSTPDITTHLYPFILSAVGNNGEIKRKKGKPSVEFLQKFTCCFSLLIENPVLVSSGIPKRGNKRKKNDDE